MTSNRFARLLFASLAGATLALGTTTAPAGAASPDVEDPRALGASATEVRADFNGDSFADLAVGVPFEDQAATDDGAVNVIYGSANGLTSAGNQVWWQDSGGIGGTAEAGDQFGYSVAAADFDGDGFTDLAVGVPGENQAAGDDGAVNVIYGSANGLTSAGNQVWWQDSGGIGGTAEEGDRFGSSLAAANLGNSTHADLAVGVPREDQAGTDDGAVNVIYGSSTGLTSAGNQVWWQDSGGIGGAAERGDQFGYSLAAANLGDSTHADLAVGVPFEDQAGTNDGAVNVIYGSSTGLTSAGNQVWWQNSGAIGGTAETSDQFGYSLAAANLGDSTHADLAVGVPFEDQAEINDGAVNVIYGSSTGLTSAGNQVWWQNSGAIGGTAEAWDLFGYSLAAANLGDSTHADLAVGVPTEDQAATDDGAVNVIYGSSTGLTSAGNQVWWQNSGAIGGAAEAGDQFGFSLVAGNFGGATQADLVVGVPLEDQAGVNDGAVNVIYGSSTGLASAGNQVWWQNSGGIGGTAEAGDQFGRSLGVRR